MDWFCSLRRRFCATKLVRSSRRAVSFLLFCVANSFAVEWSTAFFEGLIRANSGKIASTGRLHTNGLFNSGACKSIPIWFANTLFNLESHSTFRSRLAKRSTIYSSLSVCLSYRRWRRERRFCIRCNFSRRKINLCFQRFIWIQIAHVRVMEAIAISKASL